MNKKYFKTVFLLSIALSLCACQSSSIRSQDAGTMVGAVAGGLLGSNVGKGGGQIASTVIGSTAGAYIGNKVGASMDKQEEMQERNSR